MSVINAIILGLVQGITEFLPISSSGHLSVLTNLFDLTAADGGHLFYDVLLHLATLVSICVVYWQDIVEMFFEVLAVFKLGPQAGTKRYYPGARLFFMIVVATLPLALILPIKSSLESLYYNNIFIGVMLLLTGGILFVSDKFKQGDKDVHKIGIFDAIIIGLCQCVATIPGLSRSGVTITGGLATGLKHDFAVKFSFLMSLPAVLGANILGFADAVKAGIDFASVPAYLIGMSVALVSGIASISLLKYISNNGKFKGFSYYCWIAGAISIILTLIF